MYNVTIHITYILILKSKRKEFTAIIHNCYSVNLQMY